MWEQSHTLWKLISHFITRLKHTRSLCANIQRNQTKGDRIALERLSFFLMPQPNDSLPMTKARLCFTCVPRQCIANLLSLVTSLAVASLYTEPISWGCGTFAKHEHQTQRKATAKGTSNARNHQTDVYAPPVRLEAGPRLVQAQRESRRPSCGIQAGPQ